ncbi:hypothetical protein GGS23DRAFT_556771, partial [Durotheca rogersii]|uniref:uncharacterized protein n=1 Tax=Durotheca rogersii TaxID=419775 RepID=UPI0022207953
MLKCIARGFPPSRQGARRAILVWVGDLLGSSSADWPACRGRTGAGQVRLGQQDCLDLDWQRIALFWVLVVARVRLAVFSYVFIVEKRREMWSSRNQRKILTLPGNLDLARGPDSPAGDVS